jgi:hypothetical protein
LHPPEPRLGVLWRCVSVSWDSGPAGICTCYTLPWVQGTSKRWHWLEDRYITKYKPALEIISTWVEIWKLLKLMYSFCKQWNCWKNIIIWHFYLTNDNKLVRSKKRHRVTIRFLRQTLSQIDISVETKSPCHCCDTIYLEITAIVI